MQTAWDRVKGNSQGSSWRGGNRHWPLLHSRNKTEIEGFGSVLHELHKIGHANAGHVLVHHITASLPAATRRVLLDNTLLDECHLASQFENSRHALSFMLLVFAEA